MLQRDLLSYFMPVLIILQVHKCYPYKSNLFTVHIVYLVFRLFFQKMYLDTDMVCCIQWILFCVMLVGYLALNAIQLNSLNNFLFCFGFVNQKSFNLVYGNKITFWICVCILSFPKFFFFLKLKAFWCWNFFL